MIWLYDLLKQKIREDELLKKDKEKKSIADELEKHLPERLQFLREENREEINLHQDRVESLEYLGNLQEEGGLSVEEFSEIQSKILSNCQPHKYAYKIRIMRDYNNLCKKGVLSKKDYCKLKSLLQNLNF